MKPHQTSSGLCGMSFAVTVFLAGCGDRVVSGGYIEERRRSHSASDDRYSDHRFSECLPDWILNSDGSVSMSSPNVSGSLVNESIVMSTLETPLTIDRNISGVEFGSTLDFAVALYKASLRF